MRPRLHIAHKQVDYPYSADDTAECIEPKNVLDVAAQPSRGAEDRDVGFAIAHSHPSVRRASCHLSSICAACI